jgi:hypothetical protein
MPSPALRGKSGAMLTDLSDLGRRTRRSLITRNELCKFSSVIYLRDLEKYARQEGRLPCVSSTLGEDI